MALSVCHNFQEDISSFCVPKVSKAHAHYHISSSCSWVSDTSWISNRSQGLSANTIQLLVHGLWSVVSFVTFCIRVRDYAIQKFKKAKLNCLHHFVVLNTIPESWCFKYVFIGEPGGSIRSRVSDTSWGLLLEEIRLHSDGPRLGLIFEVRRSTARRMYNAQLCVALISSGNLPVVLVRLKPISVANWLPSVRWRCWLGHLACKNRPRNDL